MPELMDVITQAIGGMMNELGGMVGKLFGGR